MRYLETDTRAIRQARLQAASEGELRARLAAAGGVVLAVRADRWALARRRVAPFDTAWWCRELETLLRAGMTAVEAIETLALDQQDPGRRKMHEALLKGIHEGAPLSRAMKSLGVFPEVLVAGVTASERTSTLADALCEYLRYDEMLQRLRRQAVSAALYPVLVVTLGLGISLFLLGYVIPRFSRMYGDLHGDLSTATQVVMMLSAALRNHGLLLAFAGMVLVALVAWAWRAGKLAAIFDNLLEVVPPLRRAWRQFRLAKLYQSLAMLIRGGYTLDEALHVCGGLSLGPEMALAVTTARAEMARGRAASTAMAHARLADTTTQRLMAVGERTGGFAAILQTVADRHAQVFTTFIERATRIVEPLLLLLVALVVGGLVVMMYMPIFDIAGGLGMRG